MYDFSYAGMFPTPDLPPKSKLGKEDNDNYSKPTQATPEEELRRGEDSFSKREALSI